MPHRRAKRVLAIVALTTSFMGCSPESPPASTPTMQGEVIRLFSTPATYPLLVELSTAYAERNTHITFEIQQATSPQLVQFDSQSDAYILAHHIPDNMRGWAAPVAYDALSIIAHSDLQLSTLSPAQLRSIFQGQIQDWSQIDPSLSDELRVINRDEDSDSLLEFQRLIMGRRPITANASLASSDAQMIDMVMNTRGSIGYLMFSQLQGELNVVAVVDVIPSQTTITDQSYPLRSTLYVMGHQEPSESYQTFFDWIQGIEGQRIVIENYIPLNTGS